MNVEARTTEARARLPLPPHGVPIADYSPDQLAEYGWRSLQVLKAYGSTRDAPVLHEGIILTLRRQIRRTPFVRVRHSRTLQFAVRYQVSLADDRALGVRQHPIERAMSLTLLRHRVPLQMWVDVARSSKAENPDVDPALLQGRVDKLHAYITKPSFEGLPTPAKVHFSSLTADELQAVLQAGFYKLQMNGEVTATPEEFLVSASRGGRIQARRAEARRRCTD